jgi:putative transcriptional regulator
MNAKTKAKKKRAAKLLVGEFNFDDLLGSMTEFVDDLKSGQTHTLRTAAFTLPDPLPARSPAQIRAVREKLHASQPVFAALLNVPKSTVVGWENNQRKPSGAALKLLDIAENHPEIFISRTAINKPAARGSANPSPSQGGDKSGALKTSRARQVVLSSARKRSTAGKDRKTRV